MPRRRRKIGTVYLLHLSKKIAGHAGHYLGFTTDLEQRLEDHESGQGARLMEVAKERGIKFELVRTWDRQTRNFERQLKNRKNARFLCPICEEEARARRNWRRRLRRRRAKQQELKEAA
jgi:predicted GIY-YIG superfamily endonuclease